MNPFRLQLIPSCNVMDDTILENRKKCDAGKYKFAKWGVLCHPPCAVIGGGPGLLSSLEELSRFPGDIYAVNDTAGFLSDEGISCYMFAIDCTYVRYRTGPLVKGALFASRVHRRQFNMFDKKDIRIFDMSEDEPTGVGGGPTAVARTPHLMLRMGYRQVVYFGIEGSFFDMTHASGTQKVAYDNMIIIRVKDKEFLTNASLLLQCQYMYDKILKFPEFLVNRSHGLIKAMIENPNEWEVAAVAEDLKKKAEKNGSNIFNKEYKLEEHELWRQQMTLSPQHS